MVSFWRVVNKVILEADVILEVLDARFPEETRNLEVERKVLRENKKIIYLLNKSDLVKKKFSEIPLSFGPHVFVSAKENLGTTKVRNMLRDLAKEKKPLLVGVLGYPNTGKSSIINALKQKKSAGTSSIPGFTRGIQKIRIGKDIYVIDTPGVFAYKEKDEEKQVLTNVRDFRKVKDPESIALEILNRAYEGNPKIIKEVYKVEASEYSEITLERIAEKFNWLVKGGKPNIDQTARKIIQDWQRGKLII